MTAGGPAELRQPAVRASRSAGRSVGQGGQLTWPPEIGPGSSHGFVGHTEYEPLVSAARVEVLLSWRRLKTSQRAAALRVAPTECRRPKQCRSFHRKWTGEWGVRSSWRTAGQMANRGFGTPQGPRRSAHRVGREIPRPWRSWVAARAPRQLHPVIGQRPALLRVAPKHNIRELLDCASRRHVLLLEASDKLKLRTETLRELASVVSFDR